MGKVSPFDSNWLRLSYLNKEHELVHLIHTKDYVKDGQLRWLEWITWIWCALCCIISLKHSILTSNNLQLYFCSCFSTTIKIFTQWEESQWHWIQWTDVWMRRASIYDMKWKWFEEGEREESNRTSNVEGQNERTELEWNREKKWESERVAERMEKKGEGKAWAALSFRKASSMHFLILSSSPSPFFYLPLGTLLQLNISFLVTLSSGQHCATFPPDPYIPKYRKLWSVHTIVVV